MTLQEDADSATVSGFYNTQLSSGDWIVTGVDQRDGILSFQRRSTSRVHGKITFLGHGTRTEVRLEVISQH
jgi:hypothetical protein